MGHRPLDIYTTFVIVKQLFYFTLYFSFGRHLVLRECDDF
jgi:hypothetical protein